MFLSQQDPGGDLPSCAALTVGTDNVHPAQQLASFQSTPNSGGNLPHSCAASTAGIDNFHPAQRSSPVFLSQQAPGGDLPPSCASSSENVHPAQQFASFLSQPNSGGNLSSSC